MDQEDVRQNTEYGGLNMETGGKVKNTEMEDGEERWRWIIEME